MLRKSRLLTAVALLVAVPVGGALAQADPALVGAWTGTAVQTYPDGVVNGRPASFVFLPDGTGTTEYPSSACRGVLAPLLERGPGVFRETITTGIQDCASNGVFTFTLAADGLRFDWTSAKYGVASGVLQRFVTK